MKSFYLAARFFLLCILCNVYASAGELTAGVARVEITPPVGYPLAGYAGRTGPSTSIHDPLFATVLLLKAEGVSVAIISCDLISFPSERIVAQARERKLADHVLLAVTHTHSGPLTWRDQSWPSKEQSWFAETEEKILRALAEAAQKTFPARLATGFGALQLGYNRRRVAADGKVTMLWRNAEKLPTSPLDPTVGVIRVDDQTGQPRAIIVNYACHAVVLGADNRAISADYPGYLARRVEQEFPSALCLFTQGGAGDINPYSAATPVAQNGFAEAEKTGQALAEETIKVARRMKPPVNAQASLRAVAEVIELRDRWDKAKTLRAGLTTLLINNDLAIATLPFEPFVDLQIALRDKAEVRNILLFGYTYSAGGAWLSYLPTIQAAAEGGYGAGYSTAVEVGAGEALIDRHVINLFHLLGKFKAAPGR